MFDEPHETFHPSNMTDQVAHGPARPPTRLPPLHAQLRWAGTTKAGTPMNLDQQFELPGFLPPSSWTEARVLYGGVTIVFRFHFSPIVNSIGAEAELYEDGQLTGEAGLPVRDHNGREPFDTGDQPMCIRVGTGSAVCRVTAKPE